MLYLGKQRGMVVKSAVGQTECAIAASPSLLQEVSTSGLQTSLRRIRFPFYGMSHVLTSDTRFHVHVYVHKYGTLVAQQPHPANFQLNIPAGLVLPWPQELLATSY